MIDISTIEKDVCKSVRSLGLSPNRTRMIVDGLSSQLRSNGPDWLAERLKGLQAYYAQTGEFPGWIRKKTRKDNLLKPRGWMSYIVGGNTSADTIIVVLSTIRGAIIYNNPTPKQLDKWKSAVTEPPEPEPDDILDNLKYGNLDRLESNLVRKLEKLKPFGPDDIHGTLCPVGYEDQRIRRGRGIDKQGLFLAWSRSLTSAPADAWRFQLKTGQGYGGFGKQIKLFRDMRDHAPDALFWSGSIDHFERSIDACEDYPVGHISFLQQPFGKLRTVANPNRFVQWQLTPLGEVLSDWVNHSPGVYNLSQDEGIKWIQDRLSSGISLTSADLSSASDTLDYKRVLRPLLHAGPNMKKHIMYFVQVSRKPWLITSPEAREYMHSHIVRWKQGQPLGLRPSFPVLTLCNVIAATSAVKTVDRSVNYFENPPYAIVGDDIVIETKYAEAYQSFIAKMGGKANMDKACVSSTQAEFCSRLIRKDSILRLKSRYIEGNDPQNILTYQRFLPKVRVQRWVKNYAKRVGAYHLKESGIIPDYQGSAPKSLRHKVLAHAELSLNRGRPITTEEISLHTLWWAAISGKPQRKSHNSKECGESVRRKPKDIPPLIRSSREHRIAKFKEWNPDVDCTQLVKDQSYIDQGCNSQAKIDKALDQLLVDMYHDPSIKHRISSELYYLDRPKEIHFAFSRNSIRHPIKWVEDPHPDSLGDLTMASDRDQMVETTRSMYDYRSDARQPEVNPLKQLSKLHKDIDQFEQNVVNSDNGDVALIRPISPEVDRLIELSNGTVEVSYHSKNHSTQPTSIPEGDYTLSPKVSRPKVESPKQETISEILRLRQELNTLTPAVSVPVNNSQQDDLEIEL